MLLVVSLAAFLGVNWGVLLRWSRGLEGRVRGCRAGRLGVVRRILSEDIGDRCGLLFLIFVAYLSTLNWVKSMPPVLYL